MRNIPMKFFILSGLVTLSGFLNALTRDVITDKSKPVWTDSVSYTHLTLPTKRIV